MHLVKYDSIQQHIPSEQASMLLRMAMYEDDSTIGVDLDDDVKGFFRIEATSEEGIYNFSEWADIDGEIFSDVDTEGDYPIEEVTSLMEHRLQMFHQAF